jgi:hypothetical protein
MQCHRICDQPPYRATQIMSAHPNVPVRIQSTIGTKKIPTNMSSSPAENAVDLIEWQSQSSSMALVCLKIFFYWNNAQAVQFDGLFLIIGNSAEP